MRYISGNEECESKFWMNDNERISRMCGEERETVTHMLREREERPDESLKVDGRGIEWTKEVRKKVNN